MTTVTADTAALIRATIVNAMVTAPPGRIAAALAEGGWSDLVDEWPGIAHRILFEEAGRALRPEPLADALVSRELGFDVEAVQLAYLGLGRSRRAVARGVRDVALPIVVIDANRIRPRALRLPTGATLTRSAGIDPDLQLASVGGDVLRPATVLAEIGTADLHRAVSAFRLAQSHELAAIARAMLDLAVGHVTTRTQFGSPLGRFQAVKHYLADVALAIASADAVREEATRAPHEHKIVDMARALAGRAALAAAEVGHQVVGAMGFTQEFPLNRYARRARAIDLILGCWWEIAQEVGDDVVRQRTSRDYIFGG